MKFDWKRDLRRLLLVIVGSVIIAVNLKMFCLLYTSDAADD